MGKQLLEDDWDVLFKFLPKDLEEKAKKLGALVRKREIKSASVLLRVLFIHLADSKSLRTTCAIAKETNLCQVSDTKLVA